MNILKNLILFFSLSSLLNLSADVIGSQVSALSIALQTNARIVISGYTTACDKDQVVISRFMPDGTFDGTLNGSGYTSTIFGQSAMGKAVTVQPSDQKIVVAGYSDSTIGLLRFTTGGVLDTAFGTNGRVNLNLGLDEQGNAVSMQSGKILVAGNATVGDVTQFFVTRFNANGALDTGFGTSGITTTPIGDGCSANAMALQGTKIVLAGTAVVSGQPVIGLARYSSSGVLDTTFGTSGTTYAPVGTSALCNDMVVDSNSKIVVCGFSIINGVHELIVVRFTSTGTLDGSFGTNGVVTLNIPNTSIDHANALAIQADGNIVVTGEADNDLLVVRLNGTDGSLDTTFGNGQGYVLTTVGDSASGAAVAIQPVDQMIVVAGYSDLSALVLRYDVDGNLDVNFGGSGTGYNINPQGSLESTCGTCTVCPTGATGPGLPLTTLAVNATGLTTTTNTIDTLMDSMTLTPTAGTYLGLFNTDCSSTADDAIISASIYLNGIQLPETERSIIPRSNGTNTRGVLATQGIVSPDGSQAVEVRWNISSGTGTANNRSLHLLKTT